MNMKRLLGLGAIGLASIVQGAEPVRFDPLRYEDRTVIAIRYEDSMASIHDLDKDKKPDIIYTHDGRTIKDGEKGFDTMLAKYMEDVAHPESYSPTISLRDKNTKLYDVEMNIKTYDFKTDETKGRLSGLPAELELSLWIYSKTLDEFIEKETVKEQYEKVNKETESLIKKLNDGAYESHTFDQAVDFLQPGYESQLLLDVDSPYKSKPADVSKGLGLDYSGFGDLATKKE